jgi:hypothetical protein
VVHRSYKNDLEKLSAVCVAVRSQPIAPIIQTPGLHPPPLLGFKFVGKRLPRFAAGDSSPKDAVDIAQLARLWPL